MNENLKKIQELSSALIDAAGTTSLNATELVAAFEENVKYIERAKNGLIEREKTMISALDQMREATTTMFASLKHDFNVLHEDYTSAISQIKGAPADASTESN